MHINVILRMFLWGGRYHHTLKAEFEFHSNHKYIKFSLVLFYRAVYRDADIYLLDDPLSAVDSKVGNHIFEQLSRFTSFLLCNLCYIQFHVTCVDNFLFAYVRDRLAVFPYCIVTK